MLFFKGEIDAEHADAVMKALDGLDGVSAVFEPDDVGPAPSPRMFAVTLWVVPEMVENVRNKAGLWWGNMRFEEVEVRDWVAENQASFPPLEVGRWRIVRHGEEAGDHVLAIAPANAFGSGEHATTQQCLLHYQKLVDGGAVFAHGLDLGCGSGILALAAAAHGSTAMLALDVEAPSVAATRENAGINGLAALVGAAEGSLPHAAAAGKHYPLVFANILLLPLLELAEELDKVLAAGGWLILSGYREGEQAAQIDARYQDLGLRKTHQTVQDGWACSTWCKP